MILPKDKTTQEFWDDACAKLGHDGPRTTYIAQDVNGAWILSRRNVFYDEHPGFSYKMQPLPASQRLILPPMEIVHGEIIHVPPLSYWAINR